LFRDHLLPPHNNKPTSDTDNTDTDTANGTQDQAQPGVFHEFSALVCDPSADSQPIHPDASYTDDNLAPLWTVFVALQDVEWNMGATVFLPRTHQKHVHADLNTADPDAKNSMLAHAEYRRSTLKAGDCAVMDARTLHFGSANLSQNRRVLLYFTIRNPLHGQTDADFPKCGSLFAGLHMTTADFM
jgi:ectoine hydroxylase-related dioxygenase (phytanoyl-CoA dioxygenase family)